MYKVSIDELLKVRKALERSNKKLKELPANHAGITVQSEISENERAIAVINNYIGK